MTVIGNLKPSGLGVLAVLAAGTLVAVTACTSTAPGTVASQGSVSSSPATGQSSTTAPPSPSASPGTSATVGALVSGLPEKLLPLMPGARVISSSFDKTSSPASAALVASIAAKPAAVVAFYTKALEAQKFRTVPGDMVGAVASKDFVRADNETINIAVVETKGVSTFTIGANVAAESAK